MGKSRTVESLQVKRAEIEWAVKAYEAKLDQSRKDLAHVTAALAIFEATGDRKAMLAYANFTGIWKPRELWGLCLRFLESEGPLSTRELTALAIKASDMDTLDEVLAKIVANKIVYIMRAQEKRRAIRRAGMRDGACIWALQAPSGGTGAV
jgi:hypothetical protein